MTVRTGSSYNSDQEEALQRVHGHIARLTAREMDALRESVGPYLAFREEVSRFQEDNFSETCTKNCFHDGTSACCGREGILTFFADVVINLLESGAEDVHNLLRALRDDPGGPSCVYLGGDGCLWKVKPVVCEMFLCDRAKKDVLGKDPLLESRWKALRHREKEFTLPDRPVLFDDLERFFLDAGIESPLMYCHRSPGLLLLKRKHGVGRGE